MGDAWELEIEPEVRHWLDTLSDRDYLVVEHAAERLVDAPTTLSEPYARHLGDGLRELRFSLGHDGNAVRLTYWLAPDRRIVLLTVFRKTRMREDAEVDRARQTRKVCEAERHTAHDEFHTRCHEGRRTMNHARWKLARERKIAEGFSEPPEVEAMRTEIRMAFDLGQAVYDRRTELGISQTELARRARMTQPQISKLELGGTVPTLPLLARLAGALEASLNIALDGDTSTVEFVAHAA